MIEGVKVESLKHFSDERGDLRKMISCESPFFKKFGEVYFSFVNAGVVKGWKKHLKQTQNFAIPVGNIKLVLFDDRESSSTKGKIQEIFIGTDNYQLVQIPTNIWYAFKSVNNEQAMITNCADIPHDPNESMQLDLTTDQIPYATWN